MQTGVKPSISAPFQGPLSVMRLEPRGHCPHICTHTLMHAQAHSHTHSHMLTHVHTCSHTHMLTHIHSHMLTHTQTHSSILTHMLTLTLAHILTHALTHMFTHTCSHMLTFTHMLTHIYTQSHTLTHTSAVHAASLSALCPHPPLHGNRGLGVGALSAQPVPGLQLGVRLAVSWPSLHTSTVEPFCPPTSPGSSLTSPSLTAYTTVSPD